VLDCGPQDIKLVPPSKIWNISKTELKGGGAAGWHLGRAFDVNSPNGHQNVIFDILYEVQEDSEEVSARIGIFF
jgi:hypothetical protein